MLVAIIDNAPPTELLREVVLGQDQTYDGFKLPRISLR